MKCDFCGHTNNENDESCSRCGSEFGAEDYTDFAEVIDEEDTEAGQGAGSELTCPSCGGNNPVKRDYCQDCGAPLGVVTRVVKVDSEEEQDRVDWLVYGIETKTLGRTKEQSDLERAFRDVVNKHQSCIFLLSGPPGIGKSRVVRELHSSLDTDFPGAVMVVGKCRETDHLPYAPIARLVRKRFYIPELEIPRLARQRLLGAVQHIMGKSPSATEIAHLVGYLIGLAFPDSPFYTESDADEGSNHRVEERAGLALARMLERDAQNSPLILVIEEAHYATEEAIALIRRLASQLRASPVMFLLVAQPEFAAERLDDFRGDFTTVGVDLAPLSDEDVRRLLVEILQRVENIPESLMATVCERALGNPLIVETIVKILIGENVIDTRENPWQLNLDKLKEVELPQEFEGVVKARLGTLTDEERETLEVASVIGKTFWLGAVIALMRVEDQETGDWQKDTRTARLASLLEALRRKDMIRPHPDSLFKAEAEFVFKHGVERELIYADISPERRAVLHTHCAQWYELHGRLDRFAETMAKHWELGGQTTQAAYRYVQAANLAKNRYFNRKSIKCYEKAVQFIPENDVLTRIEALHNLGSTYELVGDVERALEQYEQLLTISWALNAKAKGGMALNKIGRVHRSLGDLNQAISTFRRSLTLFQQANDLRGIASTLDDIGKVHYIRGEYDQANRHYKAALELRRQLKDPRSIALSLHHLGNLKLGQGQFDEALAEYRESLEMRKQAGDRQGVADTLNNLGIVCFERGELQQALRLWEEALSIAQDIGYRLMEGVLLNNIGETALMMGALKTAESSLEDSATIAQECGDMRLLCDVQRNLGVLHLKNARHGEAVGALTAALTIAQDMQSAYLEGLAMRSLGELYAQTLYDESGGDDGTPAERAEKSFLRAIELLQEVGNEGDLGRTLSSYGNFLLEQGSLVQGKKQLEMAKDIFKRLEMKRVLAKTEQTIDEL